MDNVKSVQAFQLCRTTKVLPIRHFIIFLSFLSFCALLLYGVCLTLHSIYIQSTLPTLQAINMNLLCHFPCVCPSIRITIWGVYLYESLMCPFVGRWHNLYYMLNIFCEIDLDIIFFTRNRKNNIRLEKVLSSFFFVD